MPFLKVTIDFVVRTLQEGVDRLLGTRNVPRGLFELNQYFRLYDPISFLQEQQEDGSIVVMSKNFRYGSIITHATTEEELNEKIKDAILTAFEIPSSYAKEAKIRRVDIENEEYAFA